MGSFFSNKPLALKLALPIPVVFLVCLALASFWLPDVIMKNAREAMISAALQTGNQFKTVRGYYAKHVIAKAKADNALKPAIQHKGVPGTIPLPATMIHDISKELQTSDTSMALYSAYPFPNRAERLMDQFMKDAWSHLNQDPDGVFWSEEEVNGKPVIRVAIADKMAVDACVNCHNSHPDTPKNDWRLGDVRGVLEVTSDTEKAVAAATSTTNSLLAGLALVGLVILAVTLMVARTVSKPVRTLTNAMRTMASGTIDIGLDGADRRDEIGEIVRAVEVFKNNEIERRRLESEAQADQERERQRQRHLENVISRFEDVMESKLSTVSDQMTRMREASTILDKLAEDAAGEVGTAETATSSALSNVSAVVGATEQMIQTVQKIGTQTDATSKIVLETVSAAEGTNRNVQTLSDAAEHIGSVVNLIRDIAEQTNLLALNATIEAARAGESGRGFAVVASEVKELAEQTSKATDEISTRIAGIQGSVREAAEAIGDITEKVSSIQNLTSAVASAIEEQRASNDEIARSAKYAADSTGSATESMSTVSKAVSRTSQEASTVNGASDLVSKASNELTAEVANFLADVTRDVEDRRRGFRRKMASEVTVTNAAGDSEAVTLIDLNAWGAQITSSKNPAIGDTLTLQFSEGTEIEGKIVRTTQAGFGIEFMEQLPDKALSLVA